MSLSYVPAQPGPRMKIVKDDQICSSSADLGRAEWNRTESNRRSMLRVNRATHSATRFCNDLVGRLAPSKVQE